jgi:hypothetical protein
MSLFQKRHYEWLARFARQELPVAERICLRNALFKTALDNGDIFDSNKFDKATGAAEWLAGRDRRARRAGAI